MGRDLRVRGVQVWSSESDCRLGDWDQKLRLGWRLRPGLASLCGAEPWDRVRVLL